MTTVNFLEDTINSLNQNGKHAKDVLYVRTNNSQCSFSKFANTIRDYTYVNEFGCHKIELSLVVVGADWWLSRKEYDGSECWVFNSIPQPLAQSTKTMNFKCNYCARYERE